MLKRTIKGLLLDVINQTLQACLLETDFDEYCKVLNCNSIYCVTRLINNKKYFIYCDDNGLLKPGRIPSFVTFKDDHIIEVIYGNIFICKTTNYGNLVSLTEKDIKEIIECKGYINGKYLALKADL